MKNILNTILIISQLCMFNSANAALNETDRAIVDKTRNILLNPGFENGRASWTASGGATTAANSTAKGTGALGYDWDSNSASQTLQSTSVTIPNGLQSKNGMASCQIKTVSGTATHTMIVNDGTTDIGTPLTINSNTAAFQETKINFVFPASGTIRLKLASVNANEPEIYIDDCKISLADNIYDAPLVTAWTSYTPTFTGLGTVTAITTKYRRVGDSLNIIGNFTIGTVAGSLASLSLPSGLTIDTTKLSGASTNQYIGFGITDLATVNSTKDLVLLASPSNSSTLVYMGLPDYSATGSALSPKNGNALFASSSVISVDITVPILGWSAVSAVSADQTDYGDTSYTPTFTGFGTVSSIECKHSRVSSNLNIICKFTSGVSTATEARVSLPNSLTTADTTRIPSIQICGDSRKSGVTTTDFGIRSPLCTASLTYLTFGKSTSTTAPFASGNGSDLVSNGEVFQFNATIPIQGWSSNQRAPTLVGSVTSNATSALKQTSIRHTTSCTTGTCASAAADGITSCAFSSTGVYNCTVTTAYSSTPDCLFTTVNEAGNVSLCRQDYTNSTSSNIRVNCFTTGSTTAVNTAWYMQCQGPR